MKKQSVSGLSIEMRGNRLLLINRRGGYQELDITPVYFFFKEFFEGTWKKEWENMKNKPSSLA